MPNLKDLKELMTKANSEYKNSKEKNEKHYAFYTVMSIYAIASLSVFIMPKDILERDEILLKFTEFMAGYFPNISVFSEASSLPQVVAFYTALMWIMGILLFLMFFIGFFITFLKKLKENTPVFNKEFGIFSMLFLCYLGFSVFYHYFIGDISTSRFSIHTNNRFKIFIMIITFQTGVSFFLAGSLYVVASWVRQIIYKIKNKRS
ncbi:hypothetical protein [Campylobacter corcagiensis]|uniref:Uncharacterized protein n=2 Tax=Campylobacter corcagiensis TaxID=1448857 RepID=A0A7M1LGA4_9BACT|nr:hypothetical protein [Campylobacter corcagiensis]QKF64476.1 putative membrane protein [Campylobacter corcagiensis]QOQ87341.1 hypothetical protein IMC76_00525 [Campylobacter corcagiensis]